MREKRGKKELPSSVVHRLPKYLLHIQRISHRQVQWISSAEIAAALGLTSSTVRQDLSYLAFSGISKKGYEICQLESSLLEILNIGCRINMIIVGAGNLGRAVAQNNGFADYDFNICYIFDNDPQVIGQRIGDHTVRDVTLLGRLLKGLQVDIGILTVPFPVAQEVADKMMAAGIRGILNFTSAHIIARDRVRVVDNRIIAKLLELNCRIG